MTTPASDSHAPKETSLKEAKNFVRAMAVAGIVGTLCVAFIDAPTLRPHYRSTIRPTINQACAPERGPVSDEYADAGLDISKSASMLLARPDKMVAICAVINQTYNDVVARRAVGEQSAKAKNAAIEHLAASLGFDVYMATQIIDNRAMGRDVDNPPHAPSVASSGPSL